MSDNIVDIAEQAAYEIKDAFSTAKERAERTINGRYEVRVPSIAGRNAGVLDRNPDGTLYDYIKAAGGRKLPYGFVQNRILYGIDFELESIEGAYTAKAYAWPSH